MAKDKKSPSQVVMPLKVIKDETMFFKIEAAAKQRFFEKCAAMDPPVKPSEMMRLLVFAFNSKGKQSVMDFYIE